ncbi:hypothetical protein ACFOQM_13610 [Paenibacillus sp. GCM10012307]|uniref:Uncharacterized protein n=1 Tax=Paenibacillus roseus TaxID=2798579 RepID=A0A934J8F1_9BACL|nr:hypothetical protein [Paenibacillus roseus]MBJ6362332.1 hypothetical protein [Paenibacillus roseus]
MQDNNRIILPALGALVASIIGGAVWALILVITEYELGLIAWGIGGLAGYVVYLLTQHVTKANQTTAVISALLGIVLGKFFIVAYMMKDVFGSMLNKVVFQIFTENFISFFGKMDILFVLFAVLTAWHLPLRLSLQRQQRNGELDFPAES